MLGSALLVAAPTVLAEGTQAPALPKEMAQLEAYKGSWVCHGNVPAGPYGPAPLAVCSARPHAWAWRVGAAGASRRLEPGEAGRAPTFLG